MEKIIVNDIEYQIWLRIRLSIAAYAYEKCNDSIITDSEYDSLSLKVDTSIKTGNKKLDKFFKDNFDPSTGQWIYTHPELERIEQLYNKFFV